MAALRCSPVGIIYGRDCCCYAGTAFHSVMASCRALLLRVWLYLALVLQCAATTLAPHAAAATTRGESRARKHAGAIAGATVAGVAVLALVITGAVLLYRWDSRKQQRRAPPAPVP